jgi:hypothetical protein
VESTELTVNQLHRLFAGEVFGVDAGRAAADLGAIGGSAACCSISPLRTRR